MPRGDGTGPEGKGSRTGRGLGNCLPEASTQPTTQSNPAKYGRGLGPCGRGLARGFRGGKGRGAGRGRW